METKTCGKCKETKWVDFFYTNGAGKKSSICKLCAAENNAKYKAKRDTMSYAEEGSKQCVKCGKTKFLLEFHINKRGQYGRHSYCKVCHNAFTKSARKDIPRKATKKNCALKLNYNISLSDFNALVEQQEGLCANCINPMRPGADTCVDHDHRCCPGFKSCGKCVRGLLCMLCNRGAGMFADNPLLLRGMADYIEARLG